MHCHEASARPCPPMPAPPRRLSQVYTLAKWANEAERHPIENESALDAQDGRDGRDAATATPDGISSRPTPVELRNPEGSTSRAERSEPWSRGGENNVDDKQEIIRPVRNSSNSCKQSTMPPWESRSLFVGGGCSKQIS